MRKILNVSIVLVAIMSTIASKKQGGYLTHSQAVTTMSSIGASPTEMPIGWSTPFGFVNWSNLEFFQDESRIYAVYTWPSPENEDFIAAGGSCTHTWENNGDCTGPASNCKVKVTNGETVIICCD